MLFFFLSIAAIVYLTLDLRLTYICYMYNMFHLYIYIPFFLSDCIKQYTCTCYMMRIDIVKCCKLLHYDIIGYRMHIFDFVDIKQIQNIST